MQNYCNITVKQYSCSVHYFIFSFPFIILALLSRSLPLRSNSDPGSHSGPSPPLPTTIRAFIFIAMITFQHFLPSSTRVKLWNIITVQQYYYSTVESVHGGITSRALGRPTFGSMPGLSANVMRSTCTPKISRTRRYRRIGRRAKSGTINGKSSEGGGGRE